VTLLLIGSSHASLDVLYAASLRNFRFFSILLGDGMACRVLDDASLEVVRLSKTENALMRSLRDLGSSMSPNGNNVVSSERPFGRPLP